MKSKKVPVAANFKIFGLAILTIALSSCGKYTNPILAQDASVNPDSAPITADGTPSPTPVETATPTPSPSPTATPSPTPVVSPTPPECGCKIPTPTPTATPSPTPDPGPVACADLGVTTVMVNPDSNTTEITHTVIGDAHPYSGTLDTHYCTQSNGTSCVDVNGNPEAALTPDQTESLGTIGLLSCHGTISSLTCTENSQKFFTESSYSIGKSQSAITTYPLGQALQKK